MTRWFYRDYEEVVKKTRNTGNGRQIKEIAEKFGTHRSTVYPYQGVLLKHDECWKNYR